MSVTVDDGRVAARALTRSRGGARCPGVQAVGDGVDGVDAETGLLQVRGDCAEGGRE